MKYVIKFCFRCMKKVLFFKLIGNNDCFFNVILFKKLVCMCMFNYINCLENFLFIDIIFI